MSRADRIGSASAERIRDAALQGFAREGVKATSIRDVAAAAGVSPGLVQHHYPSKAALREAVDQHILDLAVANFTEIPNPESAEELFEEIGNLVSGFVTGHPEIGRYVARAMIEGEEAALRVFDGLVALADSHAERLRSEGRIRDDLDLVWLSLHLILFNMASLVFEPALDRRLPAPFQTAPMIERWNRATTDLYRFGVDPKRR
jgi:TetR/AcrR family transcriptional regulator, regulator of cefoperazone and chloramphenicol sensitivity